MLVLKEERDRTVSLKKQLAAIESKNPGFLYLYTMRQGFRSYVVYMVNPFTSEKESEV